MTAVATTGGEAKTVAHGIRLLQAMAGAGRGGAEGFFGRLCVALAETGLQQRILVRRGGAAARSLRAAGMAPVELGFGSRIDLLTRYRFGREIRDFRPHLVLTWMSRATQHCPRGDFVHAARLGGYYPLKYYRRCDHLIGNTRGIVDWLREQGWPAGRAHYLPNFVEAAAGVPVLRTSLDTPEQAPLLLALGRLHRHKAFDVLLQALVQVPEAHLWIAGEGPERGPLQRLAARLNLTDRVRFLGWRTDIADLFASADLFVCPSRVEPLGNVVIEAWAQHCPVVAAAAAGPRELLHDGVNGLLVPLEDAAALAAGIRRAIGDRSLCEKLVAGGEAAYAAEFTKAKVVAAYLDFFARVTP